jgi:conjugal transfer pilus assembly protein TraW
MVNRQRIVRLVAAAVGVLLALAAALGAGRPAWAEASAARAAEAAAAAGRALAEQALRPPGAAGALRPAGPGVYVVITWGLEDRELETLMSQARRVGYPVVARGVWRGSLPETIARLKRLAGERGERAPAMTIDPPLIRAAGVEAAPALILRGASRACVIAGRRPLGDLIARAAREWPAFRPWADAAQRALARRAEEPGRLEGLAWPGEPPACRVRLEPPPVPFAEPDLGEAMREAVLRHDWAGELARARERAAQRLREGPGLALPRAARAERRLVDPTVEVQERVVEPRTQQVLAEPGRRINPVAVVPWTEELVILDGADPAQVAWADARLARAGPARVLIARGDAAALMRRWRRPVQWLPPELVDRLGLTALPAAVRAQGQQLEVETDVVQD